MGLGSHARRAKAQKPSTQLSPYRPHHQDLRLEIDKDVVRRVLAKHYYPATGGDGSSWRTFIGHMKENLWNVDLFRCESITLKSRWVLVVMDQFTRRIIGFGVKVDAVDKGDVCQMFSCS